MTHHHSATLDTDRGEPRIAVREIDSEAELHQFVRWAAMSGVGDPDFLVEQLLGFHQDGLLGSGHTSARATLRRTLDTHGVPAAAATRTSASVAVVDGEIAGGVISGPTMWLLTRVIANSPDHLLLALLRTSEIQVLAVDEQHRRTGAGAALVRSAIRSSRALKSHVLYGQFPNTPPLSTFYRSCGLTVHTPGAAIDFDSLAGLELRIYTSSEDRFFTHNLR
ncbi:MULTISPECIES: GNAT family N-acetyltransferase [Nocardia]|uniref:GNAT family N-acetyltransferase n=1 Tax=Nocardia TaxID=1817 RepID=UPI0002F6D3E3|nr:MULTISPECIES: GNAT family N-acetyltransferase [Nocardia]